jgi:hypothetical protein
MGSKIGEGRLPFIPGAAGSKEAMQAIRATLNSPSQVTGIIPSTSLRGNYDLIHIYSQQTGYTVSIRVLNNGQLQFDTLIPGRSSKF